MLISNLFKLKSLLIAVSTLKYLKISILLKDSGSVYFLKSVGDKTTE